MPALTEAEKARSFAKMYVNIVEAMLQQGVEPDTAREEARIAAMSSLQFADMIEVKTYDPARGPCPTCGRG